MKELDKSFIQPKMLVILSVVFCFFVFMGLQCTADSGVKGSYIAISAFLENDIDVRGIPQQVLVLIDIETKTIIDLMRIPNGCAMLQDKGKLFVIQQASYGFVESGLPIYSVTNSDHFLYQITIEDTKLGISEANRINVGNSCFVFDIRDDDIYLLQYNDDFRFQLIRQQNDFERICIDLGTFFDELNGWRWPCEIICANNNGMVALLKYDSWGEPSKLYITDTINKQLKCVLEDEIYGPINWLSDEELLIWKNDGNIRDLCKFKLANSEIIDMGISINMPVASMSCTDNYVAFWTKQTNGLNLCIYSKKNGLETLFHFDLVVCDGEDSYRTEFNEYQIKVPLYSYQPIVAIVKQ